MNPKTLIDLFTQTANQDHIVKFYQNQNSLGEVVYNFINTGLQEGAAVILVARKSHWKDFGRRLAAGGIRTQDLEAKEQLKVLDVEKILESLMVNGIPDKKIFLKTIGGLIHKVQTKGRYAEIRVYGEMVDLLWQKGDIQAALQLEDFWNDLLRTNSFSLLCAYHIDVLDKRVHNGSLHEICKAHSHIIPSDNYTKLEHAVSRAVNEVLGPLQAKMLQFLVAIHKGFQPSKMPDPQSILIWLSENMPLIAIKVLMRSRIYYHQMGNDP